MRLSGATRDFMAITAGAVLGTIAAGGAWTAVQAADDETRRNGAMVAGAATLTAIGLGAAMLASPSTRSLASYGALGFVGLPSMLATGLIQNERDFG